MKKLQEARFKIAFPAFAKDYPEYDELRTLLDKAGKKHADHPRGTEGGRRDAPRRCRCVERPWGCYGARWSMARDLGQERVGAPGSAQDFTARSTLMLVTVGLWLLATGILALSLQSLRTAFVLLGCAYPSQPPPI